MKLGQVRKGSPAITTALADARSARNRATRDSRSAAAEDRASASRYKRARAQEDRERDHAMNRRIRVQVPEHDRPKTRGRTPRRLFYRLGEKAVSSRLAMGSSISSATRSIHFAVTARGFASNTGRAWRDGEGERAAQYITREDALEGGEAGWWSNIARDRNELVAFHRASEAIEKHDRANANVYVSEIIALPASLTARQRRRVVRRYCRYFDKYGIAYTVGMHKPDPAGDVRNFHCHIVYSLRPATRHGAYDWSFAVSKLPNVNTPEGIATRRKLATYAINVTLRAAGSAQRYTHLSNRARGLGAPAPKRGQRQIWVSRRLGNAQTRFDDLDQLRERVAVLRKGLAVIARAQGMRDLAISRLGAARDFLSGQMIAYDRRIARCRIVVAARLGEAAARERARAPYRPIDATKPALADKLHAAAAQIQWPVRLDQQIATAQALIAERHRRRKALEKAAALAAEPLPDLMTVSDGVLERLSANWQRIALDQQRPNTIIATLRDRAISRLRHANAAISPSPAGRLEHAGKRMADRYRLGMVRARLTRERASLPDLGFFGNAVMDRLKAAATRHQAAAVILREMLAQTSPNMSLLPSTSPPAASLTSSRSGIDSGSGATRDPSGEPRGKRETTHMGDEGGRSTGTAKWSRPEGRDLSNPDDDGQTLGQIAPTQSAPTSDQSEGVKKIVRNPNVATQQPVSVTGNGDMMNSDRNRRRLPQIRSKGPDDVTGPPPGSGRAGPER